jgi:acetylornithine deacetylase
MARIDPIELTRALVDVPSVSGEEEAVALRLEEACRALGLEVRLHEVEPRRPNLLALTGVEPAVLLCTHLDTVPPHIACSEDATHLYGRGTCDAKGIIAAMLAAVERLLLDGEERFGLLFTVAEETDSLGAKRANEELALPVRHLLVGEPTDSRLAIGQKGIVTARLRCQGRAGHGAYPEAGHSAIRDLAETLHALYGADWSGSEELGKNVLNVGLVRGGVAVNVLAPEAEADLQVRVASSVADVRRRLEAAVAGRGELTIRQAAEPLHLGRVPGMPTTVAGFGTDLPYLTRFGQRYLFGPGSILDAHTPHEKVAKAELLQAAESYARLVSGFLREPPPFI